MHNTSPGGELTANEASTNGHHSTNGHRSADALLASLPADFGKSAARRRAVRTPLAEEPGQPDAAVAFPILMVAHHLGAEPGDEIALYVTDSAKWDALRAFGVRYGINIVAPNAITDREGTRFEELEAVPPDVATMLCPDLDGTTRAEVAEFVADSALYDIADPEAALAELRARSDTRKRDRSQQQQQLKKISVAAHTAYGLAEVERGCGLEVADAARRMIDQHNRDTWNMGAAARKQRREEHTYLVTAAELVALAVPPESIAGLTAATARERSAAWADLADARAMHKSGGTADQNPVSRRWCSLDDLADMPTPGWLVNKVLPAGQLTRISGMSGSLKSFIALDMAQSVATGTPFAGQARFATGDPGHVIYVVGEGVHGIDNRIRAWCARRGIDRARVRRNLTVLNGAAQFASRRDMADVTAKIKETGARLVVFDTQARCTVGLEEDSATAQGQAIARLAALMLETGVAVLILHHTPKRDPRTARGSVAWTNAADAELIAVRDGDGLEVRLEVTKMKDDDDTGLYPLKAVKVAVPGGDSLVIAPGTDPLEFDPDLPMEKWTGKGSAYAKQIYALAQENCIPGEGLTQTRLAEIANDVVREERTATGGVRKVRRVCSKHPATAAVKLLVEHQRLVVAKRDPLGHVFYEPVDYPPSDPAVLTGMTDSGGGGDVSTQPAT